MNKIFSNLWFWVILLHLLVVCAWYYLGKITPAPTYTEPVSPTESTEPNAPESTTESAPTPE